MSDKDTIYRQAAIDALADYIHNVDKVMGTGHMTADDCKDAAASVFEELPSVQTERKKGKWIKEGGFRHYVHYCSECGWALMDGPRGEPPYIGMEFNRANYERRYVLAGWTEEVMNFCPNCGADMRTSE